MKTGLSLVDETRITRTTTTNGINELIVNASKRSPSGDLFALVVVIIRALEVRNSDLVDDLSGCAKQSYHHQQAVLALD